MKIMANEENEEKYKENVKIEVVMKENNE